MRNIMVGLTHNEAGEPIVRAPRTLKVGIGIPKGRGIRAYIHPSGEWYIVKAAFENSKLKEVSHKFKVRAEAEAFFHAEKDTAPVVGYPRKLTYFTFSRPVITKEGGELYEPDFDAIEAAGPVPTEIKVVFMSAEPFEGAYQMWSATELKCRGDGIDAMRSVGMEPNNPLAQRAKESGLRVFPVEGSCWTKGCPYANKECKVGSSINFQLARSVRVGGTAFFHTTGFRSTKDVFSSLEEIKTIVMMATGRSIIGIPMSMKLRPYITKPDGKSAATQYAVRIELDAMEIGKLQSRLLSQSIQAQTLQIAAAPDAEVVEAGDDDMPMSAQAMVDEFYPDEDVQEAVPTPPPAATATQSAQADIAKQLKERKSAQEKATQTAPSAPVQTAALTATVSAPWKDEAGMNILMGDELKRVGEAAMLAAAAVLGIKPGTLDHKGDVTLKFYLALKALPKFTAEASQPKTGDMF